jgi:hypothetical protein
MRSPAPGLYRAALWLYPPSFRREFAADLEQAFGDLRRDRGAFTTARRSVLDLVSSIPTQHLEAVMARTSGPALSLTSGAVFLAAVVAAAVFGRPALAVAPLLVAVGAGIAYRRSHTPYHDAVRGSRRLWAWFLAAGVGMFVVLIGAHAVHDNWNWFPWRLLVVSVMVGWALIATGVLLAIVSLVQRARHEPARG